MNRYPPCCPPPNGIVQGLATDQTQGRNHLIIMAVGSLQILVQDHGESPGVCGLSAPSGCQGPHPPKDAGFRPAADRSVWAGTGINHRAPSGSAFVKKWHCAMACCHYTTPEEVLPVADHWPAIAGYESGPGSLSENRNRGEGKWVRPFFRSFEARSGTGMCRLRT